MDDLLDQFTEDRLNGNYGHILDELAAEVVAYLEKNGYVSQ